MRADLDVGARQRGQEAAHQRHDTEQRGVEGGEDDVEHRQNLGMRVAAKYGGGVTCMWVVVVRHACGW